MYTSGVPDMGELNSPITGKKRTPEDQSSNPPKTVFQLADELAHENTSLLREACENLSAMDRARMDADANMATLEGAVKNVVEKQQLQEGVKKKKTDEEMLRALFVRLLIKEGINRETIKGVRRIGHELNFDEKEFNQLLVSCAQEALKSIFA